MRDLLWFDPDAEAPAFEPDPVKRARTAMNTELPRRFWKDVAVEGLGADAFRILLDGRPVKTPAKRDLVLPRHDLAEAVAAEWRAQTTHLAPSTMPHTRLANAVIDGVADRAAEVAADALRYAGSDLLCYRATSPVRLIDRQAAAWDPLLDWADETWGARLLVGEGVMHVAQDSDAIDALGAGVRALDPWRLAGLHAMTTLSGSLVIALAVVAGRLDRDAAWAAAHVDEHWSAELWGRDDEAEARLARRRRDFDVAAAFAGR
ncbi:ATPase [Siculibacillus lacustris]|uniref:ATPase n=1 Tax=Siculibacillus lacustris TaxID=1549641 RepID=A0A4Q9VGT8_9HYPH|nr:ATP12 family protein [Siculibacillus lacustris]TBW34062.1 ATPase [Siculibacillus lacustris]